MPEKIFQGPPDEQRICVTCGFCCDATIFLYAHFKPGERGNISQKLEESIFIENGEEYFMLPCPYFNVKCTIYDLKRAEICGTYRCQLLKDLAEGKISAANALKAIAEVKEALRSIMEEFRRITGMRTPISFRHILLELGKMQKPADGDIPFRADIEMLLARCNIFEALLIKHFRSAEDFEKMIMK